LTYVNTSGAAQLPWKSAGEPGSRHSALTSEFGHWAVSDSDSIRFMQGNQRWPSGIVSTLSAAKQKRRRRPRILLGAATTVLVFAVVGCGDGQKNPKSAAPAAVLDGTYRLEHDGAKATDNGASAPQPNATSWWAFHSSCGSTGCAATGTKLDGNNHQLAFTPAMTAQFHFVDGHWQSVPVRVQKPVPHCLGANGTITGGENTEMFMWSLAPRPNGTLSYAESDTVLTNECGFQGWVRQISGLVTRVGNVAPGVTVADPAPVGASPATSSPAPTVAGPVINGTYRLDDDNAHETANGVQLSAPPPNETHWVAFRSLCASSGCVATGVTLSDTDHHKFGGGAFVLRFADGHWQDSPHLYSGACSTGTGQTATPSNYSTTGWSLDPQPDGTLHGVQTTTVLTNECGDQGTVYTNPIVLTRESDVPPTVVLADPALF